MKTSLYRVDGMQCDGCARTIEALLAAEPGVQRAAVSFEDRRARVLFDPNALTEQKIIAVIEQAGFKVVAAAP